jgi:hypothetical protein
VYSVTARAVNSVSTASKTSDFFVGGSTELVHDQAGSIRLRPAPTDFYYLKTVNNIALGTEVFGVSGAGAPTDAVDLPADVDGANGRYLTYAPDLSFEVHSLDSIVPGDDTMPIHLYLGDFASKNYRRISLDTPNGSRHPQYTTPDVAADSRSVAYGGMKPTPMIQGVDSFDVFVVDVVASTRQRVTLTHTNHRNAFPTWSTNQSWLTFVSDRSGRNQWDLYGLPVTGGVVNTAQSSLKRLLNTGGVLLVGTMGSADFRKPLMAWSPTAPTLAIVASDGVLYLVSTTPAGATQVDAGVLHPTELEWSPDGSLLAITTGDKVQTVAADGTSTVRVIREGDTFADLMWSPDGTWLVYRATRGSSAWFEAYDLDQSTVAAPIAITASEPDASALQSLAGYRAFMSLRPAWSSTDVLFYPSFATGAITVGIVSVDVSGLTP